MDKSERKRVWKGGKKTLPLYIISTAVLLIFGVVFIIGYFDLWYVKDNVDFTQSVEATVTDVHSHGHDGAYHYDLFYEYTSQDGIYYSGTTGYFEKREEAAEHIGEKVRIYIDGNGTSVPSLAYRNTPNVWILILGIIFSVLCLADFIIFVIPHKWKYE